MESHNALTQSDKTRLQYPWTNEPQHRSAYGSMPSSYEIEDIVKTAGKKDRGGGVLEDDWNTKSIYSYSNSYLRYLDAKYS